MRPVGVTYFLLMSSLCLAGTAQAQDCSAPTLGDNMYLSDRDIGKTTFPDGSEATLKCAVGYEIAGGTRSITCTAGSWSAVTLRCERRDCGSPGEVENGHFEIVGTEFGDTVTAVCNVGYRLADRNAKRVCEVQGWTGRVPTCEAVVCDPPPEVGNAEKPRPLKDSYLYGDVIRYTCQGDYTLNGSSSISCSDNGKFKPDPPTCIQVQCILNVTHAKRESGALPPYRHKDFVTIKCDPGFTMKGAPGLSCEINNTWSPKSTECIAIPTTTKAATTTKATTPTKATTTTKATTASTTTRPPTPKPVPGPDPKPGPTEPPKDDVHKWYQSWWFILLVIFVVGGSCGFCIVKLIQKRSRNKRSYPVDGPI
ncbi:membrane cofactor protein-like isoform X2 [Centroberyx affinis]|uniref:membrane cofactor protein-like isoform X2 n=1 Tax=Centroberyx affinis TaxID=166261 RepID=UPI003A5C542B